MRFRLIWVGKTRNENLRSLVDDYLGRLTRFVRCDVSEVRESTLADQARRVEEESKRIGNALASDTFIVLLDVGGNQRWSSIELAEEIKSWQTRSLKEISFVVGGHLGVNDALRTRAHVRWSLSPLTLTHEMVRILLVEQLYRGFTIIHGLPYQK
jgi:23S rRNA (pseudouridine1915-N3)-methyltransferase